MQQVPPMQQLPPLQPGQPMAPMFGSTVAMQRPAPLAATPPRPITPPLFLAEPSLPPAPLALDPGKARLYLIIGGVVLVGSALVFAAVLLFSPKESPAVSDRAAAIGDTTVPTAISTAASAPAATPVVAKPPIVTSIPTAAPPPRPAPTEAPVAVPVPSPAPIAPPASTRSPSSTEGDIVTPAAVGSHRIFVDGRYVGDSPGPIHVHCGEHTVKVGSNGSPHTVSVPCGGEISVSPK
jgi:hypothetical protein